MITPTPTQVRRPWRATRRTVVQTAIPTIIVLGLVVPQVVQIILEETGGVMPEGLRAVLLGASAVVVAAAAILARAMAIPQVEDFLRRHKVLDTVAAEPPAEPPSGAHRRTDVGHVDLAVALLAGYLGLVLVIAWATLQALRC